jgi:tRNA-modifying protein YgfZ
MPLVPLPDRSTLTVAGADAADFLQRLVTCDVEGLGEDEARWGALLAPQGKILFDFLVSRRPDGAGFRLDVPEAMRADLVRRLTLYKLRAKVEVAAADEAVAAAWGDGAAGVRDGRAAGLGTRRYGDGENVPPPADPTLYDAHRIGLGIPEGGRDFAYGDAFPHEALMDQLGGVDFRKGCYVGQEVVSRMQHRGTARTRILPVAYEGPAPEPGTEVTAGGKALGRTGSAVGTRGLALLRLDRLADALAAREPVTAAGRPLRAERPAFATFEVPEAA